jgi:CBS domain containing-hemolysin-like protein
MASLLKAHAGGESGQMFEELLGRCLQLSDLDLASLMTNLNRVVTLPTTATLRECRDAAAVSGFSRLPVHDDDPLRPVGWILARDLLFLDDDASWTRIPADLIRTCPLVERSMSPWALFEEMRWQRQQMAIVTDESGTPLGLVTLEDLLEMLVGSIEDEFDRGWRRSAPNFGG